MWITFYDNDDEELAKRVWPAVPRIGDKVGLNGELYLVVSVLHDLDTRDDIDVRIERI